MKTQTKILGIMALLLLVPLPAHAAKMALSPASGEFKTSCSTGVNIVVNTEGQDSMAADAFLFYNPDEIEVVDQMSGVGGIQLRAGSVYESYPGNIVSKGIMRLTAFNRQGYYNGRGILGSIVFKAKPGIQSTNIRFDYGAGRTTDSNVAGTDSNDMLNGAYGANYTFKTGKCSADSTPPTVDSQSPAQGEIGVPLDTNVAFTIKDNMSGVDLDTVKVQVNDIEYTKNGVPKFTYEGKPGKYVITIDPEKNLIDRTPVHVTVNAQDLDKNAMKEVVYSFNELMPVGACVTAPVVCQPSLSGGVTCEATPEILKPSAPQATSRLGTWSLWFVLLCSLIYNLRMLTKRKEETVEKVMFENHKIEKPVAQRKRKK